MAIQTHRSVFTYLVLATACTALGFMLGRKEYGKTVVEAREPQSELVKVFRTSSGNDTEGRRITKPVLPVTQELATVTEKPQPLCNVHNISAPSTDSHECVWTKWKPAFQICIHPLNKDIYVSRSIKKTGIWEKHVLSVFQGLLRKDPGYGVIDIGANIGQYALLAATMGRPVVAVEARLLHVEMIHHAVQLNHLTSRPTEFVLLHNAVSDNRNQLQIRLTEAFNQGHTQIVEKGNGSGIPKSEIRHVPAILMDDLSEVVGFNKAIIKMDIEGSEHRAISHCERLLHHVYVPYMFMEWLFQKNMPTERNSILKILKRNGYLPFDLRKRPLQTYNARKWPADVIWKHKNVTF